MLSILKIFFGTSETEIFILMLAPGFSMPSLFYRVMEGPEPQQCPLCDSLLSCQNCAALHVCGASHLQLCCKCGTQVTPCTAIKREEKDDVKDISAFSQNSATDPVYTLHDADLTLDVKTDEDRTCIDPDQLPNFCDIIPNPLETTPPTRSHVSKGGDDMSIEEEPAMIAEFNVNDVMDYFEGNSSSAHPLHLLAGVKVDPENIEATNTGTKDFAAFVGFSTAATGTKDSVEMSTKAVESDWKDCYVELAELSDGKEAAESSQLQDTEPVFCENMVQDPMNEKSGEVRHKQQTRCSPRRKPIKDGVVTNGQGSRLTASVGNRGTPRISGRKTNSVYKRKMVVSKLQDSPVSTVIVNTQRECTRKRCSKISNSSLSKKSNDESGGSPKYSDMCDKNNPSCEVQTRTNAKKRVIHLGKDQRNAQSRKGTEVNGDKTVMSALQASVSPLKCEGDTENLSTLPIKPRKPLDSSEVKQKSKEDGATGSLVEDCKPDYIKTIQVKNRLKHLFCCGECDHSFNCHRAREAHKAVHRGESPYYCEICGKGLKRPQNVITHMKKLHGKDPPYKCEVCNYHYLDKEGLEEHKKRKHEKKEEYMCRFCGRTYSKGSSYYKHVRNAHEDREQPPKKLSKEKPSICDICGKQFPFKISLLGHLKIHEERTPTKRQYLCDICNKPFQSSSKRAVHMRIHNNERPFQCRLCFKHFRQHHHLKTHMRTHTGEKTFQCVTCGKCFSLLITLQRHMRIHTGERPYNCNQCGKTFIQPSGLISHKKTCMKKELCETSNIHTEVKAFIQPSGLISHEETYMKKEPCETLNMHTEVKQESLSQLSVQLEPSHEVIPSTSLIIYEEQEQEYMVATASVVLLEGSEEEIILLQETEL